MPKINNFMESNNKYSPDIKEEIEKQVLAGKSREVAQAIEEIIDRHNDAVRTLEDLTTFSDKLVKMLNHAADLADAPEVPPKKKRSR